MTEKLVSAEEAPKVNRKRIEASCPCGDSLDASGDDAAVQKVWELWKGLHDHDESEKL